ncbi:hypothetical protein [Brasilonema bromeliae]|uniref:Uncharacterized protein n=1 Tax=Brasilonema bromeliae SPC951 TaxID=385972 RepID=A0ABX1P5D5_9CYAN|nr:hypothetical protein [Brasilonema bromeliae]NMG19072.1 hypothetical protein [Brasilonema bromeliae SPC951]
MYKTNKLGRLINPLRKWLVQHLREFPNALGQAIEFKSIRVRYNAVAPNERQVTPSAPTVGTALASCGTRGEPRHLRDCRHPRRQSPQRREPPHGAGSPTQWLPKTSATTPGTVLPNTLALVA